MYSIASYETVEGVKRGLETPEEVIAKINNVFLEQQQRNILSDSSVSELPFEVNINNPRNTLLLKSDQCIGGEVSTAYRALS